MSLFIISACSCVTVGSLNVHIELVLRGLWDSWIVLYTEFVFTQTL